MNFLGFYFNKPTSPIKGKSGYIKIKESQFDSLVEEFSKDYKYIIEIEEYKNDWGYGYKYLVEGSYLILLNKFKEESDNEDSLIYFDDDNKFKVIQENFKIDTTNKQYKAIGEILWD